MGMKALALIASAITAIGAATASARPLLPQHVHLGQVLHAPHVRGHVRRYQWLRCNTRARACVKIQHATHRTYRITRRDLQHRIRVQIVIAAAAGGSTTVTSDPTPVIAPPAPVNTSLPTISGIAQQGQTLTGAPGTWQNAVRFVYQWEDCDLTGANCVPIAGATNITYVLTASDVGHTIRLEVTAFNTASAATTAESDRA